MSRLKPIPDIRIWHSDVNAGDAIKALAFAIKLFQQKIDGGMYPDVLKVWDITARVSLAGDKLRQKLEHMSSDGGPPDD